MVFKSAPMGSQVVRLLLPFPFPLPFPLPLSFPLFTHVGRRKKEKQRSIARRSFEDNRQIRRVFLFFWVFFGFCQCVVIVVVGVSRWTAPETIDNAAGRRKPPVKSKKKNNNKSESLPFVVLRFFYVSSADRHGASRSTKTKKRNRFPPTIRSSSLPDVGLDRFPLKIYRQRRWVLLQKFQKIGRSKPFTSTLVCVLFFFFFK